MSITAQFLADRLERTNSNAAAIIDAERAAREQKTARLRELRLARERDADDKRKRHAKSPKKRSA